MLDDLKEKVLQANLDLVKHNLVIFTWGNVSQRDKDTDLVVIKPSGISYEQMKKEDMVVVDLEGNVLEGSLKPSSDTLTHLEIYKKYENINSIVHTHSTYATSWAQAKMGIKPLGTTHADYFYGEIICTRELTKEEVKENYEKNTGMVIIDELEMLNIDPSEMKGILVANHGPFTWGIDANDALHNAVVLEEIAKMNFISSFLNPNLDSINGYILDKHYLRKHGKSAYYGQ